MFLIGSFIQTLGPVGATGWKGSWDLLTVRPRWRWPLRVPRLSLLLVCSLCVLFAGEDVTS